MDMMMEQWFHFSHPLHHQRLYRVLRDNHPLCYNLANPVNKMLLLLEHAILLNQSSPNNQMTMRVAIVLNK